MRNATVLLVEDSADDRELAMLAFEEIGLRQSVIACEDAENALEQFRLWGTDKANGGRVPGLILLDVKLPCGDGFRVLESVRACPLMRFVPVVMLSSSSEESDLIKSFELGANSYIRKPVGFDQFVEVARALDAYWLKLNEAPPTIA